MKRYAFLPLIFLAMVVAILLSSCQPAPVASTGTNEQLPITSTQAAQLPEPPAIEQPAATATSTPDLIIPVTAPAQSQTTVDAEVTADVLNVRIGPGLNHKIMAQLVADQKVTVEGRSKTGAWVAVLLADGREGWVYSSDLKTSADLTSLPVMEAYGGPLVSEPEVKPTAKPAGRYTLNVLISYNQAEVRMSGFAGDRDVTLRLAVPGEGLATTVASTKTDAEGSAYLTFAMPSTWPDGSALTQSVMELQVIDLEGKMLGKAKITYQSGE